MKTSTWLATHVLAVALSAPLFADTTPQNLEANCDAVQMRGSVAQISATHSTVFTSILIDAAPTAVWSTLTNFETMPDWSNGTLQTITGDISDGGSVVVTFLFGTDDQGNPVANEIPHNLIYTEGEIFGWSDPFPAEIGGGHDNHLYQVVPCNGKTLFVQSDEIVNNPYAANFVNTLLPGYQQFNAELKATVEQ
ncbi:SRPBCC family protein [Planktotalea sp.]|uniref:SRPBCC family protein n=1 Tax=Planktotalea sp. TaxID=2029877 RepID=UPI0032983912